MQSKFDRPKEAKLYALIVGCPRCGSLPLRHCRSQLSGKRIYLPHTGRMEKAEKSDHFRHWKSRLKELRKARIKSS